MNRLVSKYELPLGFCQNTLADQVTGGDTGCAFDMVVKSVRRHGQLSGIEANETLFSEMFIHQPPQLINPNIGP